MRNKTVLVWASLAMCELAMGKVLTIQVTPTSHRDKFRVTTASDGDTVDFRVTSSLPGPPKSQAQVLIEGHEKEARNTAIKTTKEAGSVVYEFELQGRLVAHAVFCISRQAYYSTGQPAPSGDVFRFKLSDFGVPRFGLYLVNKPHAELEKVELEAEPLLTEKDITTYNWATHTIELTGQGVKQVASAVAAGLHGKTFVIVADGQRCYRGALWRSVSSRSYPNPVILAPLRGHTIEVQRAYPSAKFAKGDDPRSDARILKVLRETGKIQPRGENSSDYRHLLDVLRNGTTPDRVTQYKKLRSRGPEAFDVVASGIRHADPYVKAYSLMVSGELKDERLIPEMLRVLEQQQWLKNTTIRFEPSLLGDYTGNVFGKYPKADSGETEATLWAILSYAIWESSKHEATIHNVAEWWNARKKKR